LTSARPQEDAVVVQRRSPRWFAHVLLACALALALFWPAASRANEPAPATSASAAPEVAPAPVRAHERTVETLRVSRGGKTPTERARIASQALDAVLEEHEEVDVRVEEQASSAVIFVGKAPILSLGDEDVAEGETLHVHAAAVASRIQDALRAERKRADIANTVFSFSLLVFSGLIAFLLFRRVGDFATKARTWVRENPARVPALRLGNIEVIRPNAVRGGVTIALGLTHLLAQIAIAYGWLLIAFSLFDATRGYTERLTGFLVSPLSALLGRLGSSLPVIVVAAIAALAVGVLVRFVALFFESVANGETALAWLPTDLAAPTSVLVRSGIVLMALVLSAPLLTGADDGALSRLGVAALVALGLSCVPVLSCAAAGIPIVFGRKIRLGDFVEIGQRSGCVRAVTLLEVTLVDDVGCELRVPHFLSLMHSTRILGRAPLVVLDVVVDAQEKQSRAREVLLAAVALDCPRARVELVSIDGDGAHYRITGSLAKTGIAEGELATTVADALAREGVALGRTRAPRATS
jgi:small-conductance mechanosensitive channel